MEYLNRVLQGDCHELLKALPDKSVNMVLCDPPYGTTQCEWDSVLDFSRIWPELKRICTPNAAIVMTASQPFTSTLVLSAPDLYRQHLVWHKTRPQNVFNADKMFMKYHEDILVFYRSLPTYNPQKGKVKRVQKKHYLQDRGNSHLGRTGEKDGHVSDNNGERYPESVLLFSNVCRPHEHPTQKPTELFGYLILTYTNPGDTVLDFTAGSGTTGVACKQHGRNYILIEREPKYVAIAERRISEVQPSLFSQAA